MSLTVAILGASARAAASSAAKSGARVLAADLFADADLLRIATAQRVLDYPSGLGRLLVEHAVDGWMYTGALENEPDLLGKWQSLRPLWGTAADAVRAARDPLRVACILGQAGLSTPEFADGAAAVPRDGSWLCKSRRSAGGAQLFVWDSTSAAAAIAELAGGDRYFQRRIIGVAHSGAYVATTAGSRLLGLTRQLTGESWTGASGFRYCGSIGPASLPPAATAAFVAAGQVLAETLGLRGLFGVDAIVAGDEVWFVEVNPRYTASMEVLEQATGLSSFETHYRACAFDTLPATIPATSKCSGKAILYARKHCQIPVGFERGLVGENFFQAQRGATWFADIPQVGDEIQPGWPILTLLASGDSAGDVVSRLRQQAAGILEMLAR